MNFSLENNYKQTSVLKIDYAYLNEKTVMKDCYFTSPFKIIKPFKKENGFINTMLMSSSAGIMAGDRQEFDFNIGENCKVYISSQSYEKIHKMNSGEAVRTAKIKVMKNATLVYVPQPTIPFENSAFENSTKIELSDESSKLIFCEILTSGRVHFDESFAYKYYKNLLDIYENGKLVYRDNMIFDPKKSDLSGILMYEGYTHLASQVICNFSDTKENINWIRNYLQEVAEDIEFGVSDTAKGDIVIRILGKSSEILENILNGICDYLVKNKSEPNH